MQTLIVLESVRVWSHTMTGILRVPQTLSAPLTGKADMAATPADADSVEDIVRLAQAGDSSAFGRLYEMYYDQIHRYVAFKCGNQLEAEDLTGEVFLKMIESIDKFKFKGFPFTSWLYRIAHNTVIDNFRTKGAQADGSSGRYDCGQRRRAKAIWSATPKLAGR